MNSQPLHGGRAFPAAELDRPGLVEYHVEVTAHSHWLFNISSWSGDSHHTSCRKWQTCPALSVCNYCCKRLCSTAGAYILHHRPWCCSCDSKDEIQVISEVSLPSMKIKYSLSSLVLLQSEDSKSFSFFLAQCCAVVGGNCLSLATVICMR